MSDPAPGGRCYCWFRFQGRRRPELGFYLGEGRVCVMGEQQALQGRLDLEAATHWRPLDEQLCEEFEERASG